MNIKNLLLVVSAQYDDLTYIVVLTSTVCYVILCILQLIIEKIMVNCSGYSIHPYPYAVI